LPAWPRARCGIFRRRTGTDCPRQSVLCPGVLGGGDAKLIPAVALWAGPGTLAAFLFVTAVTGGLIALAMIAVRRLRPASGGTGESQAGATALQGGVPYGFAIAVGGLIVATEPLFNAFSPYFVVVSGNGV